MRKCPLTILKQMIPLRSTCRDRGCHDPRVHVIRQHAARRARQANISTIIVDDSRTGIGPTPEEQVGDRSHDPTNVHQRSAKSSNPLWEGACRVARLQGARDRDFPPGNACRWTCTKNPDAVRTLIIYGGPFYSGGEERQHARVRGLRTAAHEFGNVWISPLFLI